MKTTVAICTAALAALMSGSPRAHHAGSMYEQTPLWVTGTVVRFENVNPHTITTLEERGADGQIRRWAVEGPARFQIERMGLTDSVPKVGDTVEICAFPYKPAAELSRMFPGVDFSARPATRDADGAAPQFVAGHIMVMPDGDKELWEPHGVISECIRSSDEPRRSWLDFIDSNPRARQAWCEQIGYAHNQSTASLRELVQEIDSSISNPCE